SVVGGRLLSLRPRPSDRVAEPKKEPRSARPFPFFDFPFPRPGKPAAMNIGLRIAASYCAVLLDFLLFEVFDFFTAFFFAAMAPGSVGAGVSGCVACASAGPAPIARLMLKMDAARSVRIVILLC